MKKLILFQFVFIIIFTPNFIFSDNFNLKLFSSQTGLAVKPEKIIIFSKDYSAKIIDLKINSDNCYSANLPNGLYNIFIQSNGFLPMQTEFALNNNEITYAIFLDPVESNNLLALNRIKSLLKQNSSLLLGFVTDFDNGIPLADVNILSSSNQLISKSGPNGYFQFYLPSDCNTKNYINLAFEHSGYITESYTSFEITPYTDYVFTIRLKKTSNNISGTTSLENCNQCNSQSIITDLPASGFVLPMNIRVGRNCNGTNCTYAEVYKLQTYCKRVLPAEIYACWGNLPGGMNSLQACAVAVRTYGMYYVYNPINPSLYDICDNTYCQYFGNTQSSNTNIAVDNTFGQFLANSSGVVKSEYAAENNNKGCGNSYSGTGSSWPCIYDPVCSGFSPNGHGRGLCQWGSVRWAAGSIITASSPCSQGNAHSYGTKNWQQILDHYYNVSPFNWQLTMGNYAAINSAFSSPSSSNPCQQISINFNITANNQQSYMLGASIAPSGSSNWISDPQNDVKRIISAGTGNYSRLFTIPCNISSGSYDLLTALWYDKNNNNLIDGGDFVVHSLLVSNAITISPIGITPVNSEIPLHFSLEQNYPNPFNPLTKIKLAIPKANSGEYKIFARLKIYDILGKEIRTLLNEYLYPGFYETSFDASDLPSGVYIYSLFTNEFSESRKMILIK
jgi:hypothetical protein